LPGVDELLDRKKIGLKNQYRRETSIEEVDDMIKTPSPSYSILIRLEILTKPGMLGRVTSVIGKAGGDIGAVDIVGFGKDTTLRDIIVSVADIPMGQRVAEEVKRIRGVNVLNVTDRTLRIHQGGKIEIKNKIPLNTREDLSMAYTPGVARVCMIIHEDPHRVYDLTIKKNTVAIVTDGTAVLGLGDIGPEAALPVMEGKAMLPSIWRDQPGGHLFSPLFRDRRQAEKRVRHPSLS
jgi:malate dehydrogenase (oxaloacetate-decarboxylating)